MENIGGDRETVSAGFLQNVQSAVNSTGVIGRVGVIETENGPMTVIFMDEAADIADLSLPLADGTHLGLQQEGDANQYQFQLVDDGDNFSRVIDDLQTEPAEAGADDIVEVSPVINLEMAKPAAQVMSSSCDSVPKTVAPKDSLIQVQTNAVGDVTAIEYTATKLKDQHFPMKPMPMITIQKPFMAKTVPPTQKKQIITTQKSHAQIGSVKEKMTAKLVPPKQPVVTNPHPTVGRRPVTVNHGIPIKPHVVTVPKLKGTNAKQPLSRPEYVSGKQPVATAQFVASPLVDERQSPNAEADAHFQKPVAEKIQTATIADQVDMTRVAMKSILNFDTVRLEAKKILKENERLIEAVDVDANILILEGSKVGESLKSKLNESKELGHFEREMEVNEFTENENSEFVDRNDEIEKNTAVAHLNISLSKNNETTYRQKENTDEIEILTKTEGVKETVNVDTITVMPDADGLYKCDECYISFKKKETLENHKLAHTRDGVRCHVCHKKFLQKIALMKHLRIVHDEIEASCPECGESFRNKEYCKIHMRLKIHSGEIVTARPVDEVEVLEEPTSVLKSIFGIKGQNDTLTKIPYHKEEDYDPKGQTRYYDYEKGWQCKICKKYFASKESRKRHREMKHVKCEQFKCNECNRMYANAYDLRIHRQNVHIGPFICKTCKRSFNKRNDYYAHQKTHLRDRYKCEICNKGFYTIREITMHKRKVHRVNKSAVMETIPKKSASVADNEHLCELCGRSFHNRSNYQAHIRVHEGYRPYKCKQCETGFSKKKSLERHIPLCGTENEKRRIKERNELRARGRVRDRTKGKAMSSGPYLCNHCNRGFSKQFGLTNHLRLAHGILPEKILKKHRDNGYEILILQNIAAKERKKLSFEKNIYWNVNHVVADVGKDNGNSIVDDGTDIGNSITDYGKDNGNSIVHVDDGKDNGNSIADDGKDNGNSIADDGKDNGNSIADNGNSIADDGKDNGNSIADDGKDNGISAAEAGNINKLVDGSSNSIQNASGSADTQIEKASENLTEKEIGADRKEEEKGANVVKVESVDKIFRCKFCKQCFNDRSEVKKHVHVHKFVCVFCNKKMKDSTSLKRHQLALHFESNTRPFNCPKCSKGYVCEAELLAHMTDHIGPWICAFPGCGAQFSEKIDLNTHRRSHAKGKFECSCKMKFCRKDNLVRHYGRGLCPVSEEIDSFLQGNLKLEQEDRVKDRQEFHTETSVNVPIALVDNYIEKSTGFTETQHGRVLAPFKCKICLQQFSDNSMVKKHIMMRHSNDKEEKQFKCETCDFATHFQYVYKKHLLVHNRPFPCQTCKRSFETKEKLENHMATHFKDKYQCFYCSKLYLSKKSCKDHIMIAHSQSQREHHTQTKLQNDSNMLGLSNSIENIQTTTTKTLNAPLVGELPENIFQTSGEPMEDISEDTDLGLPVLDATGTLGLDTAPQEEIAPVKTPVSGSQQSGLAKAHETGATPEPSFSSTVYEPMSPVKSDVIATESLDAAQTSSMSPQSSFNPEHDYVALPVNNHDLHPITPETGQEFADKVPTGLEEYEPIRENYKCGVCSAEFQQEKDFRSHLVTNHTENTWCNVCKENLETKFRLNNHMLLKHGVGNPLICPKCGAGFQKADKYWSHAQKHAGLFTCQTCGKTFNQKGDLNQHMVLHVERNFICVKCGEIFNQRILLKNHKKEKHGINTYIRKAERQTEIDENTKVVERFMADADFVPKTGMKYKAAFEVPTHTYVDSHGHVVKRPASVGTSPAVPQPQTVTQPSAPQEPQTVQIPNSDVTIQVYADGTLVTSDKSGTNYSNINLDSLGLDPSMLQGEASIELVIVQGDGKEVRATIKTSLLTQPAPADQTPTIQQASNDNKKTLPAESSNQLEPQKQKTVLNPGKVDDSRPFKCTMCPRTFKFFRTFRCHEIVHYKKDIFSCPICKRVFAREVNLHSHLQLHKKKTTQELKKGFVTKTGIKRNKRSKEEVEKSRTITEWKCDRCDKIFSTIYKRDKHVKYVHEKVDATACPICHKTFNSESAVQRHLKVHVGPFKCMYCSVVFKYKEQLNEHMITAHPQKFYTCTICNTSLSSKKFYWAHMRRVHGNKSDAKSNLDSRLRYSCSACGKTYNQPSSLKRHKLIHTGEKKFLCPHCPSRFNIKWKLQQHMRRIHDGKRYYRCEKCDQGFKLKEDFSLHTKKYHTGPYSCDDCSETYTDRRDYETHRFQVHKTSGFNCIKCSKRFRTKKDRSEHVKAEHLQKTCLCDVCGASFSDSSKLKYHLVKEHFNGDKEEMLKVHPNMLQVLDPLVCAICNDISSTKLRLKLHYKGEHFGSDVTAMYEAYPHLKAYPDPPDPVVCDHCGKVFTQIRYLHMHIKSHNIDIPYKMFKEELHVLSSDEETEEKLDLKNIEPRHTSKNYKCSKCRLRFSRQAALKKHEKTHTEEDETKEALSILEQEEVEHAETAERGDTFPDRENVKTSYNEKRKRSVLHICKVCEEMFKTKSDLNAHVIGEHGENQDSNDAFADVNEMEEESSIKVDTPKKTKKGPSFTHVCAICEEMFKTEANLNEHMIIEHEENNDIGKGASVYDASSNSEVREEIPIPKELQDAQWVWCTICDKSFTKQQNLRRHMESVHTDNKEGKHEKKKPLQCSVCHVGFSHMKSLERHMKNKHQQKKNKDHKSTVIEDEVQNITDIDSFLGMNFNLEKKTPNSCNIEAVKAKRHKCKLCGEGFSREATLKKHLLFHDEKSDDEDEDSDKDLLDDLQKAIYPCKECGNMYSTAKGLLTHTKDKHATVDIEDVQGTIDEVVQMGKGGDKAEKKSGKPSVKRPADSNLEGTERKRMRLDNAGNQSFPCEFCGAVYSTFKGVDNHEKLRHQTEFKSKEIVQLSPVQRKSKSGRVITASQKKREELECDKPSKKYSIADADKLKVQTLSIKTEKTTPTGKPAVAEDLSKHFRTNDGYKCTECDKTWPLFLNLKRHMTMKHRLSVENIVAKRRGRPVKTVTGKISKNELYRKLAKGYECCQCDKLFTEFINLRRHLAMKHKVKIEKEALSEAPPESGDDSVDEISDHESTSNQCDICEKQFCSLLNLRKHKASVHNKSEAEENTIPVTSNSKSKISLVKVKDEKQYVYECTKCSKLFTEFDNLRRHISMKHSDLMTDIKQIKSESLRRKNIHTCEHCEKRFPFLASLKGHLRMAHNASYSGTVQKDDTASKVDDEDAVNVKKETFECSQCQKPFVLQKNLDIHMRKHTGETPYSCSVCQKKFISMFKLECHLKKLHQKEFKNKINCKVCLSLFGTKASMLEHRVTHKKEQEVYECRFCRKGFKEKDDHDEHLKLHTDRPYKCQQCNKAFRWRQNLRSHNKLFHNESNHLVCGVCKKVFLDKTSIDRHMVIHKVKTFPCKHCSKTFQKEVSLQTHTEAVHKSVKKSDLNVKSCDICKSSFTTTEKLLVHMLSHTSMKPFKCNICSASYKQEHSLKSHKLTHTADERRKKINVESPKIENCTTCRYCGKTFSKIWNLKVHTVNVHKTSKKALKSGLFLSKARQRANQTAKPSQKKSPYKKNATPSDRYCTKCEINFSNSSNYARHCKKQHSSEMKEVDLQSDCDTEMKVEGNNCPICRKEHSKRWNLKMHMRRIHKVKLVDTPPTSSQDTLNSQGLTKYKCLYCPDCARIYWSQENYNSHLKQFHPDKTAIALDMQVLQEINQSEIKTEVVDPAYEKNSSPVKQRKLNFGPMKHKCEFCNRVHWTKKSFDEHMVKFHPEKIAENPNIYGDGSQNITKLVPVIEVIDDRLYPTTYLSVEMDNAFPAHSGKLSAVPVVLLERLSATYPNTYEEMVEDQTNEEMINHQLYNPSVNFDTDSASDEDIEEISIGFRDPEQNKALDIDVENGTDLGAIVTNTTDETGAEEIHIEFEGTDQANGIVVDVKDTSDIAGILHVGHVAEDESTKETSDSLGTSKPGKYIEPVENDISAVVTVENIVIKLNSSAAEESICNLGDDIDSEDKGVINNVIEGADEMTHINENDILDQNIINNLEDDDESAYFENKELSHDGDNREHVNKENCPKNAIVPDMSGNEQVSQILIKYSNKDEDGAGIQQDCNEVKGALNRGDTGIGATEKEMINELAVKINQDISHSATIIEKNQPVTELE